MFLSLDVWRKLVIAFVVFLVVTLVIEMVIIITRPLKIPRNCHSGGVK